MVQEAARFRRVPPVPFKALDQLALADDAFFSLSKLSFSRW
jgi:hypothetical protein